jgi:hypothetical protein
MATVTPDGDYTKKIEALRKPCYDDDDDAITEVGFKDLRMGVLSRKQMVDLVWHWLGNHGCFTGGAPLADGYHASAMVAPATTPFECLYLWVPPKPSERRLPLMAVRMRVGKGARKGRIYDAMEILPNTHYAGVAHDKNELTVYSMFHEDNVPEPDSNIGEKAFLDAFPEAISLLDPAPTHVPAAAALPVPSAAPASVEEDRASVLSAYSGPQRAPDANAEKADTAAALGAYTVSMKRDRDEDEEEAKEEPPAKRPRTDDQPMVSTQ